MSENANMQRQRESAEVACAEEQDACGVVTWRDWLAVRNTVILA